MTLNKSKVNTDQNLMPKSLAYKYVYQRALIPSLVIILSIILVSVVVFYGVPYFTNHYMDKGTEFSSQSMSVANDNLKNEISKLKDERDELQADYDNYYAENPFNVDIDDSILTVLGTQVNRLTKEYQDLLAQQNQGEQYYYPIEALFSYIDSIRSKNLVIVSLEDKNSADHTADSPLVYENDLGEASFSLHGMCTDSRELSQFLLALNECPQIKTAKILSVETQTVSEDQNLYVFEVSITPNMQ
jgi:hypothetical protein